jgi:hypothetical protein
VRHEEVLRLNQVFREELAGYVDWESMPDLPAWRQRATGD